MEENNLRNQSGADSYLAEIKARKAKAKREQETVEEKKIMPVVKAEKNAAKLIVVPTKREARARDKHIKIKPSLDDKAIKKCKREGISFNEVVNQLLEIWVASDA